MGLSLANDLSIDLPHSIEYRKAILSIYHIVFADNDNHYVFPMCEKESIKAALEFYDEIICKKENYPVFNGKTYVPKPVNDREVIRQILGIPKCVFDTLNLEVPILEQLQFDENLNEERRNVYEIYYGPKKTNWYRDDFKSYCIKQGVYFLYDETKPFVSKNDNELPVYFLEKRLDPKIIKPLYEAAKSEKIAIEFLGSDATCDFIKEMEKLDCFSFSEQTDYFVNGFFNPEIANIGYSEEFKKKYEYLLRLYIASLINVLYDQYSFSVLNKVTQKISFMSQSETRITNRYFVLSSFQGEIYSLDGNKWFFNRRERERIKTLIENTYQENPHTDILCFYAHLELPYIGYQYVKDLVDFTPDDIMGRLKFKYLDDYTIQFLSAKRFDRFYSYLTGENEHRFVFLKRILREQGFIYIVSKPFEEKYTLPISLYIQKKERIPELEKLIDIKGISLYETIYLSYHLDNDQVSNPYIQKVLKEIDEKSDNQACREFFYSCLGTNIEMATEKVLSKYHLESFLSEEVYRVFRYLFFYPFKIVLAQYRSSLLTTSEIQALTMLDGPKEKTETYEPNLPYPFVSWGSLCYSFKETYFSQPYICTSEKEAIEETISFYGKRYDSIQSPTKKTNKYYKNRNEFIINHIGLPKNIKILLSPEQNLIDQIPFKDHICHRCLNAEPAFSMSENDNVPISGWTYINSDGAKNGFFPIAPFQGGVDYEERLYRSIITRQYHALIEYDPNRISPILLPYLKSDRKSITALLGTTFTGEFFSDQGYNALCKFIDLGEDKMRHILFDCRDEDFKDLMANGRIFNMFALIYCLISVIYPIKTSEKYGNSKEIPVTMNDDDNDRLCLPHVLLGSVFNAYQEKRGDKDIYFCSCDKEAIRNFLEVFYEVAEENHVRKDIETPMILAQIGLPYEAILSLEEYDFSLGSIDDFVNNRMKFRDFICRRCSNINHSALINPFFKAFPYKETKDAEINFARNAMAHDGLMLFNSSFSLHIQYTPDYRFDLDDFADEKIPYVYVRKRNLDVSIYQFFAMDYETLKNKLYKFSKTQQNHAEAAAYASGIILDTHRQDPEILYKFIFGNDYTQSFRQNILMQFPQINRVRKELLDETMQMILLFVNFLLSELIQRYAQDEMHVGR